LEITEAIGTRCFFACPNVSWQRGTNDHVNGLVSGTSPRGLNSVRIYDEQVAEVESLLKNKHRLCHCYITPQNIAIIGLAV